MSGLTASVLGGKAIADWGAKLGLGVIAGALGVFLWLHPGCGKSSDQALLDSNAMYQRLDSVHKAQIDSITIVSAAQQKALRIFQDSLDAIGAPIVKYIETVIETKDSADCLKALQECDSLVWLYAHAAEELKRYSESRDLIIGMQSGRIDDCRNELRGLLDSVQKMHKPLPKIELPSIVKFDANAFLGFGFGTSAMLGLRADAWYKHIGIFLQLATIYIKQFYGQCIGGAEYHF